MKLPKAFDASRAVLEVMDTVNVVRSGIADAIAEWRSMPFSQISMQAWLPDLLLRNKK